jgi:hypothetical protein
VIDGTSVAEVQAHARAGNSQAYDLIAFRASAVAGFKGVAPLRTLAEDRVLAERRGDEKIERLLRLRQAVKPLSVELKLEGRVSFELLKREICFKWQRDGRQVTRWIPVAAPPAMLLEHSQDADASPQIGKLLRPAENDLWWLPFSALLAEGRFLRMQECLGLLHQEFDAECFHLFISHRW